MTDSVRDSIYQAIASIRLIDPHTHINPHAPASSTLADLLGYHYYTELAHSAGMPKDQIEQDGLPPRELVGRLVGNLSAIENTAQYRWLVEICRMFFGFDGDRIDSSNWQDVYDAAERQMRLAEWPQMVLDQSNVEAVFLTNDFDDELSGFDTDTFIPCLRTDDLVFHLAKPETRERLAACTEIELDGSLSSLRRSLKHRFEHFVASGARACAISLPPTFEPKQVSDGRAATALDHVLRQGQLADESHKAALSRRVFWTLAELCDEYGLPFDLMIGVNRGVYTDGVYQGQDLYDSRVSLIQYRELFNAFPSVKFPISVLASVTNQELVSYAWIFPNVITNGHWWYSNTPSFIARDAAARLEAVPQTKQIAYYSDAYKLEFVWPKFDMYRHVLSGILADHFVKGCQWSEERAIELGRQILRDNVDEIFPRPAKRDPSSHVDPLAETWNGEFEGENAGDPSSPPVESTWVDPAVGGTSAALAAGAIGMVEVSDAAEPVTPEDAGPTADADVQEDDQDEAGFSTVIGVPPESGVEAEDAFLDETLEMTDSDDEPAFVEDTVQIETVIEEPDDRLAASAETVRSEDWDEELPDLPTMLEIDETVEIEAGEIATSEQTEELVGLDPLPNDDEVQALELNDVELRDLGAERASPDAETIESQADPEPLDLGDLLGDDDESSEVPEPHIRLLRGEESFEPDEESLQLHPDPLTGELTFPVPSADEAGAAAKPDGDAWSDDELVLDVADEPNELEETLDFADAPALQDVDLENVDLQETTEPRKDNPDAPIQLDDFEITMSSDEQLDPTGKESSEESDDSNGYIDL